MDHLSRRETIGSRVALILKRSNATCAAVKAAIARSDSGFMRRKVNSPFAREIEPLSLTSVSHNVTDLVAATIGSTADLSASKFITTSCNLHQKKLLELLPKRRKKKRSCLNRVWSSTNPRHRLLRHFQNSMPGDPAYPPSSPSLAQNNRLCF